MWWSKAVNRSCFLTFATSRTPRNPCDMCFPLCVGDMCDAAMFSSVCALPSPTSAEFAPLCSIGSSVLWRSPTSPARARPPFGLWPSRTGLDHSTKTHKRSPGSRACCFSACAGSTDYAGPKQLLALNAAAVLPSSSRNGVGILCHGLFEAQSPRPLIPLSTLQPPPCDDDCKTRGQDGFAVLLSCRALSSPTTCRFSPAHSVLPVTRPQS